MKNLTYNTFYGGNIWYSNSSVVINFDFDPEIINYWYAQRLTLVRFLNSLPKISLVGHDYPNAIEFSARTIEGLLSSLINCMYGKNKVIRVDLDIERQHGCIIYELIDERLIEKTNQVLVKLLMACGDIANEYDIKIKTATSLLVEFYTEVRWLTPDINHYLFVIAANEKRIPHYWLHNYSSSINFVYGQGWKQQPLNAARSSKTSRIGVYRAGNKEITKDLLHDIYLPAPRNISTRNLNRVYNLAKLIGLPVVIKPLDGNGGRDVVVNLTEKDDIVKAAEIIIKKNQTVLVEEYIPGDDYRVLVVNNQVAGVVKKFFAQATGNGKNTVSELIDIANQDPRRGGPLDRNLMVRISVNTMTHQLLEQQGLTLDSVPPDGMIVRLAFACNLHSGGTAIDVTDQIHPDNVEMAIRAAQQIGLDIAGIDYITPDISRSYREVRSGICEVNSQPGLDIHAVAENSQDTRCAKIIMDYLFPDNDDGRVPSLFLLDDPYPSPAMEFLEALFMHAKIKAGVWEKGNLYINNKLLGNEKTNYIDNIRTLTRDPWSETLLFECHPESVIREGLGMDLCTASLMLGVENLPDDMMSSLFKILETATAGVIIVNADYGKFKKLIDQCQQTTLILLTCEENNPLVKSHIELGNKAYTTYMDNGILHIMEHANRNSRHLGGFLVGSGLPDHLWQSIILRLTGSIAAFELLSGQYVSREWLAKILSLLRHDEEMQSKILNSSKNIG